MNDTHHFLVLSWWH